MRDFAKTAPAAWQGDIKKLRGDPLAIAVYYHLTTSPHSSMIGVYHCPIAYIANDIGAPLEGASKGLRRVIEEGICSYDDEFEIVWVHEMASTQVAPTLKPTDKQVAGIARQLLQLQKCAVTLGFYARYQHDFCLRGRPDLAEYARALEGPSEGLRSKEKEKEKETEQDKEQLSGSGQESIALTRVHTHVQARESQNPDWIETDWQLFDSTFANQTERGDSELQATAFATARVERARQFRMERAA